MAQPKEALAGATQPITISGNAVATPPNQTMGNSDIAQFTNTSSAINATVTFLGAARYAFGNNYGSFSVEEDPMVRSTEYRSRPGDGAHAILIYADKQMLRAYDWAKRHLGISDELASKLLGYRDRVRRKSSESE